MQLAGHSAVTHTLNVDVKGNSAWHKIWQDWSLWNTKKKTVYFCQQTGLEQRELKSLAHAHKTLPRIIRQMQYPLSHACIFMRVAKRRKYLSWKKKRYSRKQLKFMYRLHRDLHNEPHSWKWTQIHVNTNRTTQTRLHLSNVLNILPLLST